jgi:hypothetical protein
MSPERALVTAGAGALLLCWLFLALRGPALAAPAGGVVLRYRSFLRVFAWVVALGIPALVIFLMVRVPVRDTADPWWAGALMLGFGVLDGLLLLETERTEVALSEQGIKGVSPWRGQREFSWGQVGEVSFSGLNRWFVVRDLHGSAIRVSLFMDDVRRFVAEVKKHVPADKYVRAQRGFPT